MRRHARRLSTSTSADTPDCHRAGCDGYSTHFSAIVSLPFPMGILCCQSQMGAVRKALRERAAAAEERLTAVHGVAAACASSRLPQKTASSVAAASTVVCCALWVDVLISGHGPRRSPSERSRADGEQARAWRASLFNYHRLAAFARTTSTRAKAYLRGPTKPLPRVADAL